MLSSRVLAVLSLALAAATPSTALAGKGNGGGKPAKGGPSTDCTVQSYSYDSGGTPGTGAANDPLFGRQWGLTQINAPTAWQRGATGAGVTIAIVDSGVDLNHPDLSSKLVAGADFQAGKRDCPPGPQDENGHGTHVAGIAAAITNNGIGGAGTAPDAKIMPVRVLDAEGSGALDTVVAGIKYAADHGAEVINLSLGELPVVGQLEALNQDIEDAVNYAWDRGAVVIGAAGNETFPLCSYPAAAQRSVCVGATDSRGLPSYYSSFPNNPHGTGSVGVRAPGGVGSVFCEDDEDIWSSMWPGSDFDTCGEIQGYETLAGTSMATPFVSGVAAMLFGQGLSNQQVLDRLRTTSSNGGAYDPVYGYGIVDADAATG
jgi:subtilisin family serine protease